MDIAAPEVPVRIDRERDRAKAKSLRRQLLMSIHVDLMHRPNAIQRNSWNGFPVLPRETKIKLVVEMIVQEDPELVANIQ